MDPALVKFKKLKYGLRVHHRKYGYGMIISEWGAMNISEDKTGVCSCADIYDVRFRNRQGQAFLHCCHARWLDVII